MALDYSAIAATALRLVQNAGRQVTFMRFNQTPDSGTKPWGANADLRSTPDDTVSLWAVSVHPTDINVLGIRIRDDDLLKQVREILIIAPGPDNQEDLRLYQQVTDGRVFRIVFMEQLKPNDVTVLWYAGITE